MNTLHTFKPAANVFMYTKNAIPTYFLQFPRQATLNEAAITNINSNSFIISIYIISYHHLAIPNFAHRGKTYFYCSEFFYIVFSKKLTFSNNRRKSYIGDKNWQRKPVKKYLKLFRRLIDQIMAIGAHAGTKEKFYSLSFQKLRCSFYYNTKFRRIEFS